MRGSNWSEGKRNPRITRGTGASVTSSALEKRRREKRCGGVPAGEALKRPPAVRNSLYASSVTTITIGAPPELIEAACAKASLPPLEAAQAFTASSVGKLTSDIR